MQNSNIRKFPTQPRTTHQGDGHGADHRADAFRRDFGTVVTGEVGASAIDLRPRQLATSGTGYMMCSWSDIQAMADRAARGAEVPFAQSAWFGAAAARHLAAGRNPDDLSVVLSAPDRLIKLSLSVERAIEKASMGAAVQRIDESPIDLLRSYVESMPCAADAQFDAAGLVVRIKLGEQTKRERPSQVAVPDGLWAQMEELARQSYVPGNAASRDKEVGADLMKLD